MAARRQALTFMALTGVAHSLLRGAKRLSTYVAIRRLAGAKGAGDKRQFFQGGVYAELQGAR